MGKFLFLKFDNKLGPISKYTQKMDSVLPHLCNFVFLVIQISQGKIPNGAINYQDIHKWARSDAAEKYCHICYICWEWFG